MAVGLLGSIEGRRLWVSCSNSQRVDVALYKGTTFVQRVTRYPPSSAGCCNWTILSSSTSGCRITILDCRQRQSSDSRGASFSIN